MPVIDWAGNVLVSDSVPLGGGVLACFGPKWPVLKVQWPNLPQEQMCTLLLRNLSAFTGDDREPRI
jgi:hypothetical protein